MISRVSLYTCVLSLNSTLSKCPPNTAFKVVLWLLGIIPGLLDVSTSKYIILVQVILSLTNGLSFH